MGGYVRCKGRLGYFTELEAGKDSSWLQDTISFREYCWHVGAVSDPKRDSVYIVCIVGKFIFSQVLCVTHMKGYLGGWQRVRAWLLRRMGVI